MMLESTTMRLPNQMDKQENCSMARNNKLLGSLTILERVELTCSLLLKQIFLASFLFVLAFFSYYPPRQFSHHIKHLLGFPTTSGPLNQDRLIPVNIHDSNYIQD